jgi:hypothetical protein
MATPLFWTPERKLLIQQRYPTEGPQQLALEFGKSPGSVTAIAATMGLRSLNRRTREGLTKANKSQVNYHYFKTWSPEMAYCLGYLWADGSVTASGNHGRVRHHLQLKCITEDEAVILYVRKQLNSNHRVKRTPAHRNAKGIWINSVTQLKITCYHLVRSLIDDCGLLPAKSKQDLEFPHVPSEFLSPFTRGYLDGDGSPHIGKDRRPALACYGTHRFIEGLQEAVHHQSGASITLIKRMRKHQHLYGFWWRRPKDLKIMYSFLYPETRHPHLLRKKSKLRLLTEL